MKVDIPVGTIFTKTHEAYNEGIKCIVHKGGTGSGKTFDIMLFLVWLSKQPKNKVITVVSESFPHLTIGSIRILKTTLIKSGIHGLTNFVNNPTVWTNTNGNIIEFFSADRIDKALGARRDVLYGNEINSLKREVWDELSRRSELIIADFNPTAQFWLEDWIQDYEPYRIITSNYLDNPFLPETERGRIEKRASRDANFRRIHIDCEYGVYEGLVFTDWRQCDDLPAVQSIRYGLDFGYTNDPTALIKVAFTPEAIYLDELIYRTGMLNRDIVAMFKELNIRKNFDEIIADSAEPKTIDELRLAGYNVKPALKGADSVNLGIDRLKSKPMYVTKRSVNLIRELRNYAWVTDKNGNATNKPIDMWNHAIDAARYATESRHRENKPLEGIFF